MNLFTLDIETLPSDTPEPTDPEERRAESLDGAKGRILCVSFIDELTPGRRFEGVMGWNPEAGRFDMDERLILEDFWLRMKKFNPAVDRVVGHNVMNFDWPFIIKRSRVHGIRPTCWLSLARYRNQPFYDTMMEWDQWSWQPRSSLDTVAKVLGLEGKFEGIDGSQVYEYWRTGRHKELYEYSLQDVRLAREIYSRMSFEERATNEQTKHPSP